MTGKPAPWTLYIVGAVLACLLNWLKVPALAFSLGMFIPMNLNAPLLVGGAISWLVGSRTTDKKLNEARQQRGTLLGSGFIAGGALMGVVSAALLFFFKDGITAFVKTYALGDMASNLVSLVLYILLIAYFIWACMKAKKE